MDLVPGLKQMEGTLSLTADRIGVVKAKLEDILFRAQKIATAAKNNMKDNDQMFGWDLNNFRRDLRTFGTELAALPTQLGAMEKNATADTNAVKFATGVMRGASRVANSMKALLDMALLAHQHIRAADHKITAWYIAQEIEEMGQKCAGLPATANKIVLAVSATPAPAAPAAPPPAAPASTPPAPPPPAAG